MSRTEPTWAPLSRALVEAMGGWLVLSVHQHGWWVLDEDGGGLLLGCRGRLRADAKVIWLRVMAPPTDRRENRAEDCLLDLDHPGTVGALLTVLCRRQGGLTGRTIDALDAAQRLKSFPSLPEVVAMAVYEALTDKPWGGDL